MNEHDHNNLEFLLSVSNETLLDWYSKMSKDDIDYAFELLRNAQTEINMHILSRLDSVVEVAEAERVLKKFMS